MRNHTEGLIHTEAIRQARLEAGLTQDALAKQIGVTRQTVCLIEAGRYNPTLRICVSIAEALDKQLFELFG